MTVRATRGMIDRYSVSKTPDNSLAPDTAPPTPGGIPEAGTWPSKTHNKPVVKIFWRYSHSR